MKKRIITLIRCLIGTEFKLQTNNITAALKNRLALIFAYVSVSSLKAVLSAPLSSGALDLSGIPLTARDMERLCAHLQRHASTVVSLELGFSELTDEAFLLLLPTLAALPHLETLALNGNRLTRAVLKELTDALKVRESLIFGIFSCICQIQLQYSMI